MGAIVIFCLIMIVPSLMPSPAQSQTAFIHPQTGIQLPRSLGPLRHEDLMDYAQEGRPDLGFKIRYSAWDSLTWADVYLYDLKRKNLGTGITSPEVMKVFEMAKGDIYLMEKRGRYKNVRKIDEGTITLRTQSGILPMLWAAFTYERLPDPSVDYPGPVISHLYLTAYKNYFLKVRVSSHESMRDFHHKAVQQFLEDLGKVLP